MPSIDFLYGLAAGPAGLVVSSFPEALAMTGTDTPAQWVGWSADGRQWGWESMPYAFGLDDTEVAAHYAVGTDFVIAMVTSHLSATPSGDTDSQFPETRWFIARVP